MGTDMRFNFVEGGARSLTVAGKPNNDVSYSDFNYAYATAVMLLSSRAHWLLPLPCPVVISAADAGACKRSAG